MTHLQNHNKLMPFSMFTSTIPTVFAMAATMAVSEAAHYQVYLLGGQSNGNGRADAAQLTAPLDSPQTDVRLYWHRTQVVDNAGHLLEDQWINMAPGSGCGTGAPVYPKEFGCEVSFGRSMADAKPSENIAIIKYTHGGTNLQGNWSAGGFQYTTFKDTVQAGLTALTTAGHTYELKGMLWQQGEADTGGVAADNYQANLESLIARVRTDLNGGVAFPFVIGSLSDSQYSNITDEESGPGKVRLAQETVAANDPTVGIVITDGYSTRPADSIHFDHTAQVTLGVSFTDRMLELENPVPPSVGRPNVIFIISDDHNWYDYSFMYRANVEKSALDANLAIKQVAETPAIDRLVDEGLTFTHGYATPLCRPSLASMITGTYPHQSWITGNDLVGRVPDQAVEARMQVLHPLPRTLASYLGYTSFQTGKWWEGHHTNGGFTVGDTVNSTAAGTAPPQWGGSKPNYVTARHGDWGLMTGRVDYVNDVAAPVLPAPGAVNPISYANTVQTVTDFIDAQAGADQPFFLWYAPFLPHDPFDPPADLRNKYLAKGLSSGDANYYANIERFDGGVGAILDHLDALEIADNTIVVMICDNGRDMPNGKRSPYDGGIRTPVIVRWPDQIKPGGLVDPQVVATPVSLVDMVPTVHHAVGLPVFPEMTGVNLLDLGAVAARDTVFGEDNHIEIQDLPDPSASLEARFAIRDGWKLILFAGGGTGLYHLYDTTTGNPVDPFESTDLSGSNPALVSELTTAITDWYDAPKGQQVSNSEAASFTVANDDLLEVSLDATTPVTTTGTFTNVGGVTVTGEPALRNGVWDNDGSGRAACGTSNGATATYFLDLSSSPLGYTIDQIDLFSNWGPAQDHDEIRVSIDYSVVGSPTNFDNHIVINGVYNPPTETQGKMSITNIGTAGVAAIRFTWPASQENGAAGYSEIDVLGSPDGGDITTAVLLHHWTFDVDGSDSAGTADTTIETGASITTGGMGIIGEALSVPSAAVGAVTASVGAVTLPESDFTFTAWVKPDPSSPDDFATVMGNQNTSTHGAFLRIDDEGTDGDLFGRVNNASGSLIEGGTVDKNVWTHVAMTVSSTAGLTIHVNGVPVGNNPAGISHIASNLPFEIGTRASDGTQDFWGLIDDVRIYGGTLTQSEIAALAEAGSGAGDPSPVTSAVVASPTAIPANDTTTSTITVTMRNAGSVPVPSRSVSLAGNTGNATITAVNATTDVNGQATFTVRSNTVGTELFTATDVTGGGSLVINQTASVDFQAFTAPAGLLFYEPFTYTAGALDGQGGWSSDGALVQNGSYSTGSTGSWNGTSPAVPTSGGNFYVGDTSGNTASSIALSSTVTNSFTSGSTTWLSVVAYQGYNGSDARWAVAIGADVLTDFNEMNGQGLGVGQLDQGSGGEAHYWTPNAGGSDRTTTAVIGGGRPVLAVVRIDWAANGNNDTITVGRWDQSFLTTPTLADWNSVAKATLSVDLDQSTFDTLTLAGNTHGWMDEIRIGTTFENAVSGTVISGGSKYATWSGGEPFDGDKNGDRVENGIAFLLGADDPDANALGLVPTAIQSGGSLVLNFSCLNSANRGDSQLSVEHSSDLGFSDNWLGAPVPNIEGVSGPVNGVLFNVTLGDPLNSVIATILSTEAVEGKLFWRFSGAGN